MLNFDTGSGTGSWGASIQLTKGSTLSADARTMLTAGAWQYWLKGPVVTQVIVEDRSPTLTYDLGWDAAKPIHPIFVLTFYPGWRGVKIEYIVENCWDTKIEDVNYTAVLKSGGALNVTQYRYGPMTHYAMARWRKTYWDGTAPGPVNVNYNLAYLTYSRALPNYDLSKAVSAAAVSAELADFNASDRGQNFGSNALALPYFPTTGGRPDIGYTPSWNVRYLFTFDPSLSSVFLGTAGVSGHIPIHLRESRNDATKKFCDKTCTGANATANAFGRPLSIDARPTVWASNIGDGNTVPADNLVTVGNYTSGGWTVDEAHQADFAYVPYLITGDWYFLEELYFWSSYNLADSNPGTARYSRHADWGFFNAKGIQVRGAAWSLRTLGNTAFIAPDATPEQDYYVGKLRSNIAILEGTLQLANGAFPPANASCPGYDPNSSPDKWCWGYLGAGEGMPNPLFWYNYVDDDNRFDAGSFDTMNASIAGWTEPNWQDNFVRLAVGRIKESGFSEITSVQTALSKNLIHQLTDTNYNPFVTNAYYMPVTRRSDGKYFQTWAEAFTGWTTAAQKQSFWFQGTVDSLSDVEHGYTHIERAAASFLPGITDGGLTGQAAWNWINDPARQVSTQPALNDNPKWAIIPRTQPSASNPCDLNGDGTATTADVQIAIGQALGTAGCSTADMDQNGRCDVVDVQRIINAVNGSACRVGP